MDTIVSSVEIGSKIREYRQKAGLTQEGLAELVGVTFQQIQKYENGSSKLNTDKLQKVAQALSIPVMFLFPAQSESLDISDQEQTVIACFRAIPDAEVKKGIVAIMRKLSQ